MAAFSVSLNDPENLAGARAAAITETMAAAAGLWGGLIQGHGTVDIQIDVVRLGRSGPLATGGSASARLVDTRDGVLTYQQGSAWELQTGIDITGSDADLIVTVNADWLDRFFFDPTFAAAVPANRLDAGTIFLHEIGHGLAFLSVRNDDGTLPTATWTGGQNRPYQLVYDSFISLDGDTARFVGPNTSLIAGAVPLAGIDNASHTAADELMNPYASYGERSLISTIDIAVAQDVGLAIATARADIITLLGSDDLFAAGAGDDSIAGGAGRDTLIGGEGQDVILSNQGDDIVFGNQGDDILVGGQGADIVIGGQGQDIVYGNEANDLLFGNEGNDTLFAGQGADTVYAGQGDDTLWGHEGNDLLSGGQGADRFVFAAGSGIDTIDGFDQAQGDWLDLQGQTFTQGNDAAGALLLALSGGGSILLPGSAGLTA